MRRIFRWGVGEELVSAATANALQYVAAIHAGQSTCPERPAVIGVPDEVIEATLPHLTPTVADLVRVMRIAAMRPTEACLLRWEDIDQSDPDIWVYVPCEHKTEHRGKVRPIPLTASAQQILNRYRGRPVADFIFSPAEAIKGPAQGTQDASPAVAGQTRAKKILAQGCTKI